MKEQLVSFKVAKLAKEKGFDVPCISTYKDVELYHHKVKRYNNSYKKQWIEEPIKNSAMYDAKVPRYSAPTQSLLQKWLREKYKIFVDCSHSRINDDGEVTLYQTQITSVSIGESYNFKHHKESNDCYGETYEEALEKGLQEALKLI